MYRELIQVAIENLSFEIEKSNFKEMSGNPPGLAAGGFGDVGEAKLNVNRMVRGMARSNDISENVLGDRLNIERYVQELTDVCREMLMASGSMFERAPAIHQHVRSNRRRRVRRWRRPQVPEEHHEVQSHPVLESGKRYHSFRANQKMSMSR